MNLITLIIQIILTVPLTIILNYLQNKTGKRIHQILIPTIYIIFISALFPVLKENIFLIVVFEIFIRNFYVTSIVNQNKQISNTMFIIESVISISLSLFTYNYFIKNVSTVIPNPEDIKSFLWFLIIIYFASLFNNINKENNSIRKTKSLNLKNEQIIMQYAKFKNSYSSYVRSKNININNLIYAIMIYNDIKTPKLYRGIKTYIGAITKKETTYGIMQVKSFYRVSDEESILKTVMDFEQSIKDNNLNLKDINDINKLLNEFSEEAKEEINNIYRVITEFSRK